MNERWFRCDVRGFPTMWTKSVSHGKARYKCVRQAREAGYKISFKDVTVKVDQSGMEPAFGTILR